VREEGWKAIRDAKQNSPDMMVINIKDLLRNLAEERMLIDSDTTLDEAQKSKRKANIADEVSKWTKVMTAAQKEMQIPLGTYLKVMDQVFDAIRDEHPELYLKLIDFQEKHIHRVAAKYQ